MPPPHSGLGSTTGWTDNGAEGGEGQALSMRQRAAVAMSLGALSLVMLIAGRPAPRPDLEGPWRVSFDPTSGGPEPSLVFDRLQSWPSRPEPGRAGLSSKPGCSAP